MYRKLQQEKPVSVTDISRQQSEESERDCNLQTVSQGRVCFANLTSCHTDIDDGPPRWPSGKASASRAEDPGFESRFRRDFFGVESYQSLQNWHSSGYPARRMAL